MNSRFLVVGIILVGSGYLYSAELNTDRPGSDYRSETAYRGAAIANDNECQALCEEDAQCKAWTFVKGANGTGAQCFLKAPAPNAVTNICCVSGLKGQEYDTDRVGGDYRSFSLNQPDPRQCQGTCEAENNCKAWTYVNPGVQGPSAQCYLKSTAPDRTADSCCVSGRIVTRTAPERTVNFIEATRLMKCDLDPLCEKLSGEYYRYIGVWDSNKNGTDQRGDVDKWKSLHGFSLDPKTPAHGETRATYYNKGDLAIGRDMHCRTYPSADSIPGFTNVVLACYVTNYGDNSGSFGTSKPGEAISNAQVVKGDPHNPIATVAMETVYTVGFEFAPPEVKFIAYGNNKKPVDAATLDASRSGTNKQAIPGVCMACHGGHGNNGLGSPVTLGQDGQAVRVDGAKFLPFDPAMFLYGDGKRTTPNSDEQEAFRKLNATIRGMYAVKTIDPIKNLIDGWYSWCGGVETAGCTVNEAYIPSGVCRGDQPGLYETCGWATGRPPFSAKKPGFDVQDFYRRVPAQYCRNCHIATPEAFNVQSFRSWMDKVGQVDATVNGNHSMPFAEVPYNNYWNDAEAVKLLSQFLDDVPVPKPTTPQTQQCLNTCKQTEIQCRLNTTPGRGGNADRAECGREGSACAASC